MLSKHQTVTIYEDAIKQTRKEGNAEIVAVGREVRPHVFLCEVHFLEDGPGETVTRLVSDVMCCCLERAGDNPSCQIHTVRVGEELAVVIATRWGS